MLLALMGGKRTMRGGLNLRSLTYEQMMSNRNVCFDAKHNYSGVSFLPFFIGEEGRQLSRF
jgi:hypothetical protein